LAEGKFIVIACNLLDKNDSYTESKKQIIILRKNTKKKEHEFIQKSGKVSIDNTHNEDEESHEIKFQKKIIRCFKFFLFKNLIIFYLDLGAISKNFSETVGNTFSKHSPYKFESWMISKLKFKVMVLF